MCRGLDAFHPSIIENPHVHDLKTHMIQAMSYIYIYRCILYIDIYIVRDVRTHIQRQTATHSLTGRLDLTLNIVTPGASPIMQMASLSLGRSSLLMALPIKLESIEC